MSELSAWPALVLTAGLATRLRPLSDVRAKAAMPVAGRPIIDRILSWLRDAGVARVVLNLHHRPESITRLVGDGRQWGLDVRYSWEPRVLGSAGGPRRALPILGATRFLIVNGDTLTDCDLEALVRRHRDTGAEVTMAVVPGDVGRYGGVVVGPDGFVTGFARAAKGSTGSGASAASARHFIGVQAVTAGAFAAVSADEPSETVREWYPRLIAADAAAIAAYESEAEFLDVGTAADYLRTVEAVASREGAALDVGEGTRIDPAAEVRGTILWDRVVVPAGAELINCVVADDVHVPAQRFERCTLVTAAGAVDVRRF